MENIQNFSFENPCHIKHFKIVNDKFVPKKQTTLITLTACANDLRYCNWGVQNIWDISIVFPTSWVQKTLRRIDDNDFSKVEKYINKHLKKNGFNTISIKKDAEIIGVSPKLYRIENIEKERI
tara:strand:- start:4473 stop:4841 length:369 start_codon:yes stop_codon:yes gene_type:complete